MRMLLKKITKTCIGIIMLGILAGGMVNAQKYCCNVNLNSCKPTFKAGAGVDVASNISSKSLSHSQNKRIQLYNYSKKNLRTFRAGQECCKNDCSENYNRAAYVHTTISQVFDPYQLNNSFVLLQKGIYAKFEALSQPRTTLSVPISQVLKERRSREYSHL